MIAGIRVRVDCRDANKSRLPREVPLSYLDDEKVQSDPILHSHKPFALSRGVEVRLQFGY